MNRDVRCQECDGYGYVSSHPMDGCQQSPCPSCGGQGFQR